MTVITGACSAECELVVPGDERELGSVRCECSREVDGVVATQRVVFADCAGLPRERSVDADQPHRRARRFEVGDGGAQRALVDASGARGLRPGRRTPRGRRDR
jgi:hypothetical protein